jgi:hypothetical protein
MPVGLSKSVAGSSFKTVRITRVVAAKIPGPAIGNTTFRRVCIADKPSEEATSSNAFGDWRIGVETAANAFGKNRAR